MDSIFDSIKDSFIDKTVDNAIDNLKVKEILKKTFVWTAINRETSQGKLLNLTFITKYGKRQRVSYDRIEEFCANNYVSNIIVNNGKISVLGATMNQLPEFKLMPSGQYVVNAIFTEQQVYQSATSYICSQERKILEDYNNGCLKGTESEEKEESSLTKNLSNIKQISNAAAVTAMSAAATATVVGAGKAAKSICKAVNKKKLASMQSEICTKLDKAQELANILLKTKRQTNDVIRRDQSICTYTNTLEASNNYSSKLKNEINTLGIVECTNKVYEMLSQCKSKASSNNILTEALLVENSKYGNLQDYISSIENIINNIKQEHLITQQLVSNNIQLRDNQIQLENQRNQYIIYQQQLDKEIKDRIHNIENELQSYDNFDYACANIIYEANKFFGKNLEEHLQSLIDNNANISDENSSYSNKAYIDMLVDKYNNILDKFNNGVENRVQCIKSNCIKDINDIEAYINSAIAGKFSTEEYNNVRADINNKINNITKQCENLSEQDSNFIHAQMNNVVDKLNKADKEINLGISKNEKDKAYVEEINSLISKYEYDINNEQSSRKAQNLIDSFQKSTEYKVSSIKNVDTQIEVRKTIDLKVQSFRNRLETIKSDESAKENNKQQVINNLQELLDSEIARVESIDIDKIEVTIQLEIDLSTIENEIKTNDISNVEASNIRNKIRKLNGLVESQINKHKRFLQSQEAAKKSIENKLNNLEATILTLNKFNINRIQNNLLTIKTDTNYKKLLDTTDIDGRIQQLESMKEQKIQELGL